MSYNSSKYRQKTKVENDQKPSSLFLLKELAEKGSYVDKISSLCSLIKKKPDQALELLTRLINLCDGKNRRETYIAIEKTTNAFMEVIEHKIINDENSLKILHSKLIEIIKNALNDPIFNIRIKMIGFLIDLLRCVTFNQRAAVIMVINKFGDPDNRVSAHAQTLLHRILNNKTQNHMLIVGEVCAFLTRPNLGFKPRYYSMCFLNQIVLNAQQPEVANALVGIFLNLFNNFNFEEDTKNKMAESILTGISRAIPYTKDLNPYDIQNIDKIFLMANSGNFSASIRALIVLFHVKNEKSQLCDRYYKSLYGILFKNFTSIENHSLMLFFNLMYKSLASDPDPDRQRAVAKRLLQVCLHQSPEFSSSCILLISEVFPCEKDLVKFFTHIKPENETPELLSNKTAPSSWDFASLIKPNDIYNTYDWRVNDPKKCGSSCSPLWENVLFSRHYHASMKPFMNNFLEGKLTYDGDPLTDFTHTAFIDRFIRRESKFKHPKSINERKIKGNTKNKLKTTDDILARDPSSLSAEEILIQNYHKTKQSLQKQRKYKKRHSDISSDEEPFCIDNSHKPKRLNSKTAKM